MNAPPLTSGGNTGVIIPNICTWTLEYSTRVCTGGASGVGFQKVIRFFSSVKIARTILFWKLDICIHVFCFSKVRSLIPIQMESKIAPDWLYCLNYTHFPSAHFSNSILWSWTRLDFVGVFSLKIFYFVKTSEAI